MHLKVVGCCIMQHDKFLMLKRRADKSQGGLWGLPAGKIESGELPLQAIVREVSEETGITLDSSRVNLVTTIDYDFGEKKVDFHLFVYSSGKPMKIKLNPAEHDECAWFTFDEAYANKELMHGVPEILDSLKRTA